MLKMAYDNALQPLVELLKEAQQADALAGTQRRLLANEASHSARSRAASD